MKLARAAFISLLISALAGLAFMAIMSLPTIVQHASGDDSATSARIKRSVASPREDTVPTISATQSKKAEKTSETTSTGPESVDTSTTSTAGSRTKSTVKPSTTSTTHAKKSAASLKNLEKPMDTTQHGHKHSHAPATKATVQTAPAKSRSAAPATATATKPTPKPVTAQSRGEKALRKISYDWRSKLPGWKISFHDPKPGVYGYTFVHEKRIEVYLSNDQSDALLAHVVAHEIGHAIDVTLNSPQDRSRWQQARSIGSSPWWPGDGAPDFSTGAGDFAESFAAYQVGSESFRSNLAGPPTSKQLSLLVELANS